MTAPRLVSLIASSTEIIHALGLGDYMVGRSHECDYPAAVKSLPVCTAPKFNVDGSSKEIDARVKEILEKSLSVYLVDARKLDELAPTHVLTQAQCEVCAVSLKDVQAAACELIHSRPEIISLSPNCLEDYFLDLEKVGASLQVEAAAQTLIEVSRKRLAEVKEKARRYLCESGRAPLKVAVIEWIEPLMAAGNWMPELVEMAGGINLFGEAGRHSPWMDFASLQSREPDVIIVTPCGFDNERTLKEMPALCNIPGFHDLQAVKNERLYIADGNQYFNRPGPRLMDSLEILAEIFYPQAFPARYQESWLNYSRVS
ncbi:MAG TPA: cobalamin-binding protein [Candidatus Obscuribacter sp.]|nr:cobalamin-binding protein [Candidatus Obscuribacter sp.]HNG20886.1 cobalamin-binding protein [Candidatus Obscuribacter sp.]HNN63087.1 cobalamin-binding protein [Candidatus Obscuribacter sp.]